MEIGNVARFNEWWTTSRVNSLLLKPHKRPLFFKISGYMKDRQIILLTGLRRVGKTTLAYQIIDELLKQKVNSLHIMYFSFDEKTANLDELIKAYEEGVLKKKIGDERIYVFLDEIQKCSDWESRIKILYDLHPNIKFVITGSASVKITKKAKESLAGRMFEFHLWPLSFGEFIEWKGLKLDAKNIEMFQQQAMPLFSDYLRKGGFPEITDEESDEKIKAYIKNSVIDQIIYRDLPEEFGVKDYELLNVLIESVATNPGMIINYDALSRNLKRSKTTIINYLFYLQYAMLIRFVSNFRGGFLVSSRKMRKAYISNTAISFAMAEDFYSNSFMEKMAENFAVIETEAGNYFHNKYEVDIILKKGSKITPIEVKYGKPEIGSLLGFLGEFKIKSAVVVTKDLFDKKMIDGKQISFVPLWAFSINKAEYLSK